MATNCEWKLQQTTNCGWKWKWEETVVGRCKCRKLRWEVAKHCGGQFQQTANDGSCNKLQNVELSQTSFKTCFSKRVLSTRVLSKRVLPKRVRSTAVGSCNKLRLEVATHYHLILRLEVGAHFGMNLQKLGMEDATNYKWKLQQSTNCGWKLQ